MLRIAHILGFVVRDMKMYPQQNILLQNQNSSVITTLAPRICRFQPYLHGYVIFNPIHRYRHFRPSLFTELSFQALQEHLRSILQRRP